MRGTLEEVDDVLAVARAEEELRSAGFHRNVAVLFDPRFSAEEFRSGGRRSILQGWVDAQGAREAARRRKHIPRLADPLRPGRLRRVPDA